MAQVKNVLLIDDDEINNMVCTKIIQKNSFSENVATCLGGRQALTHLREAMAGAKPFPDMIFLDINMPVMNGWDFLEQYQQIPELVSRHIPIVMLSSSSSASDIEKSRSYPQVVHYVTKPLNAGHLEQIRQRFFSNTDHEQ